MSILEALKSKKILISDGAWGTFLHQKGLKAGECPELWNVTQRDDVIDIAGAYIDAGADMIETNSFGGSPSKLEHYGLSNRTTELNEAAAAISRDAAGPDRFVLGSIGPTGKILMMGDISEEELYEGFRMQAAALEQGGADAICIETMAALDEAVIAVKAARENTKLEIICTMTFDKTQTGEYRTMMGVSPTDIVIPLQEAGARVIGTNCGNGMSRMIDIVAEIRKADKSIPILVHANAGMPEYADGKTVFPEVPEEMAAQVNDLVMSGANIIGGCCGTTPQHIIEMVKAVKSCQ